jgi:uncharacterized protein YdcH (DUF465 family)
MEQSSTENLLQQYQKELIEDLKIDELNLKDKTMLVPIIKHKWVARQMTHKSQLKKLTEVKKKIIKEFTVNTPVALSKQAIEQASSSDPKIISIQEKINELDIVIEYLEKIEKAVSSLTFDCKNVIDLQKLETT